MSAIRLSHPLNQLRDGLFYKASAARFIRCTRLERYQRNAAIRQPNPGSPTAPSYVQFATMTAASGTGPDGTNTAFFLKEDATGGVYHNFCGDIGSINAFPVNTPLAVTYYFLAGTRTKVAMAANGYTPGATRDIVNLVTGAVTAGSGQTTKAFPCYFGGVLWWEVTMNWLTSIANTARWNVSLVNGSDATSYAGDNTSGLYVWGEHLLLGRSMTGDLVISTAQLNPPPSGNAPPAPSDDTTDTYYVSGGVNRLGSPQYQDDPLEMPAGITTTPVAMTLFIEFFEAGSAQMEAVGASLRPDGTGVVSIGKYDGTGARLFISTGASGYRLTHHNGTSSVYSEAAAFPALGDTVQLRAIFNADGSVQLGQSINGAAEVVASASAALTPGTWGANSLFLNGIGKTAPGFIDVVRCGIVPGVQTSAVCQTLIPMPVAYP